YYPKFGFIRSGNYGIKSEYDVPDDVFMIQELKLDALKHVEGVIKYHDAFNDV
ncbi:MAG: putative acetyltransferase, partial [Neolewinella sp.]